MGRPVLKPIERIFSVKVYLQLAAVACRRPFRRRRKSHCLWCWEALEFPLNQTQNVRPQAALRALQDSPSNPLAIVTVADTIPVGHEDGILKGHGTSELNGEVVATLCGVVERVNKLVYVRAFKSRYKAETGEIVVGRVTEIAPKRWKIDINSSQEALRMHSSMNLSDGIQRWRATVDELNMRTIFEENVVICAEVRDLQRDGSLHLQARSQKYGKLGRGQLSTVPSYLVKRRKQHFHHLDLYKVDLILGCNGYVWVGEHNEPHVADDVNGLKPESNIVTLEEEDATFTPSPIRENICRIANAIRVLGLLGFAFTVEVILDVAELSTSTNPEVRDMLGAEFFVQIAGREVGRRKSSKKIH